MNEVVTIYDSRRQGLSTSYLQYYGEQKDKWIMKVISSSDEFIEESWLQPEKKYLCIILSSICRFIWMVLSLVTQQRVTFLFQESSERQQSSGNCDSCPFFMLVFDDMNKAVVLPLFQLYSRGLS